MIPTEPGWWSVRWKGETGWHVGHVFRPLGHGLMVNFCRNFEPYVSDPEIEFGRQLFPGPAAGRRRKVALGDSASDMMTHGTTSWGWGCRRCRTQNSGHTLTCRLCGHGQCQAP